MAMTRGSCAFIVLAALIVSPAAPAATLTGLASRGGNLIVVLEGTIADGDAAKLNALIKSANDQGHVVSAVRLNSPGGSLREAASLADAIRTARISTIVPVGSSCASACFIAFAAGIEKVVSYGGLVGVHGAADKSGKETVESGAATVSMARMVKEFGVPPGIIGKMVVTRPSEIVWLTPEDLQSMGAIMVGRPAKSSLEQQARPENPAAPPDASGGPTAKFAPDAPLGWSALYKKAFNAAERGNYTLATRIWLMLAEQGDALSQYNLGQLYYAGEGVPQNYGDAAKWFRRSAEQGIPQAQQNLGTAYALGRGVPQDFVEAYKWLNLAAARYATEKERSQTAKGRDLVASRMTTGQVAEAQRLTREWVPQPEW